MHRTYGSPSFSLAFSALGLVRCHARRQGPRAPVRARRRRHLMDGGPWKSLCRRPISWPRAPVGTSARTGLHTYPSQSRGNPPCVPRIGGAIRFDRLALPFFSPTASIPPSPAPGMHACGHELAQCGFLIFLMDGREGGRAHSGGLCWGQHNIHACIAWCANTTVVW